MILGAVRLIVFVLDTAIWMPVIGLVSLCEREGHTAFRVGQWWAWVNLKLVGAHLTVEGLEHLDPNRSYVFVSNHRSNLDVLALVARCGIFSCDGWRRRSCSGFRSSAGHSGRRNKSS